MKARIGERLLFRGKKVGSANHTAEVLQVRGDDGAPPYLVRFGDGHGAARLPRDGLPGPARRPPSHPRRRDLEAATKDPTLAAVNLGVRPPCLASARSRQSTMLLPAGSTSSPWRPPTRRHPRMQYAFGWLEAAAKRICRRWNCRWHRRNGRCLPVPYSRQQPSTVGIQPRS